MRGLTVATFVGFVSCFGGLGCATRNAPGEPIGDPLDPSTGGCNDGRGCSGGLVCTRNDRCLPAGQVRAVHVTWMVSGAAPTQTSCGASPDLVVELRSSSGDRSDGLEFSPVPCVEGKFSVDRLPIDVDRVAVTPVTTNGNGMRVDAAFDATGNAALNLAF